jgi:tetratricopeptide (TPR) repeat protein
VPMPGNQLTVCDTLPRLVRDGLGRLHSLGSSMISRQPLEAALEVSQLSRAPPTADAYRRAHDLLGSALKLRWGVLLHLGDGSAPPQFPRAMEQLLRAQQLIRSVGESIPADDATATALTPLPAAPDLPPASRPPSVHVYPQLQVVLSDADTSLSLATVHLHQGQPERATEHATAALGNFRRISAHTHAAVAQLTLSECSRLCGDQAGAEEQLRGALRAFRTLGCVLGQAEALRLLGSLRLAADDEISGQPLLHEAVELYQTLNTEHGMRSTYGESAALELLGAAHAPMRHEDAPLWPTSRLLGQNGAGSRAGLRVLLGDRWGRRQPARTEGDERVGKTKSTSTLHRGLSVKRNDPSEKPRSCLLRCSCWGTRLVIVAEPDEQPEGHAQTGDPREFELQHVEGI